MTPARKPSMVDRIVRRLRREIRQTKRSDWTDIAGAGNVERDRYIQGLRDAAEIVLDMPAIIAGERRAKMAKRKRGNK
jgi:hypothetical protein